MTATCAVTIVIPGRLAVGIVLAAEMLLLTLAGTLFNSLLKKLRMDSMNTVSMCVFIVSFTVFFKQLLSLFMPETALQLSFVIYLPPLSSLTTVFLIRTKHPPLKTSIPANLAPAVIFAVYIIVFTLIRDIVGYGTITLPAPGKAAEFVFFPESYTAFGTFFATIPGALVLSALFLTVFLTIEENFKILIKAGIDK